MPHESETEGLYLLAECPVTLNPSKLFNVWISMHSYDIAVYEAMDRGDNDNHTRCLLISMSCKRRLIG